MAGAAPNVGNVVETHAPQRQHSTENLTEALKEVSKHLARMLLDAFKINRSRNTQTAPSSTPVAQQPHRCTEPAAPANAANSAPPAQVFDAKKWLTDQCKQLNDALGEKTNNQYHLNKIYKAAESFKNSVSNDLPENLKADFEGNISVIQQFFNDEGNQRAINPKELQFLIAYIKFLKAWVNANPELAKIMDEVCTALRDALAQLEKATSQAHDNVVQSATQVANPRGEPNNTQLAAPPQTAASTTAQQDATNGAGPSRGQQQALDRISTSSVRPADVADLAATVAVDQRSMPKATRDLITAANTLELQRLLPQRNANAIENHFQQTCRQLSDTVNLLHIDKKADKTDWFKHSVAFQKLAKDLASATLENPNNSLLPDDFSEECCPRDPLVNGTMVNTSPSANPDNNNNNETVFKYALDILKHPQQHDDKVKILACQVLGNFSAMQVLRNSDAESHDKSSVQMRISAQLLAAELASKATINPPINSQQVKAALTKHASEFGLKTAKEYLDIASDEANPDELRALFHQGVTLDMVKTNDIYQPSLTTLLKQSKTDRTYENDVTALNGKSRQKVFKEAMFRALALVSGMERNTSADGKKPTRTAQAENVIKSISKYSKSTLEGSNGTYSEISDESARDALNNPSDELLNQLVLASMVHNDLSLDKNHVSRGSMMTHFKKYDVHPQWENMKNHGLHGYKALGEFLVDIEVEIRDNVNNQILQFQDLNPNTLPSNREIDRLVKKIIVTTDAKATINEKFNLRKLVSTAESLKNLKNYESLNAFKQALTDVQDAWDVPQGTNLAATNIKPKWITRDQRSAVSRALKSNVVKSLPYINQIPVVGRLAASASHLAKGLLAATAGAAAGSGALGAGAVAVAGLIGGVVVAAPVYGTYRALKTTFDI